MTPFGEELRKRRKERRFSMDQLSLVSTVSKTYIANIERDTKHAVTGKSYKPSVDIVDKLALALDWPLSEARRLAGYAPPQTYGALPPISSYVRDSAAGARPSVPKELENVYYLYLQILGNLPDGPDRERYLAKLRTSAEADLALISRRDCTEGNHH